MTERLQEFPDTKLERGQRLKNALGRAAVKTTALVAVLSAATAGMLLGRHGSQEVQAKASGTAQEYALVDNPYTDYSADTNSLEKSWCKWPSRWSLCNMANDVANEADSTAVYLADTYGWAVHNGEADAVRHCVWSGWMTRDMGAATAQGFTDRHEDGEIGEPQDEYYMDMANNQTGRQIGQGTGSVYDACLADAENGTLEAILQA